MKGPEEKVRWDELRQQRLAKLQAEMAKTEIGGLFLTNPLNIRYATGTAVMTLWTSVNITRYAFVPVQGDPIIFEYGEAIDRARALWKDSRPASPWQFRFAGHQSETLARKMALEIKDLLKKVGGASSYLGIDVLDHIGHEALREAGLRLKDSDGVFERAREVKTEDELTLLRKACAVGDAAVAVMEQAIAPGISENKLLSLFWGSMLAQGGEYCSTRLLSTGERTNPWFQEAGERTVKPGDLVAIDTDMKGPGGYLCDISRTFLCGERPTVEQREAYRVAYDYIHSTLELIQVGTTFEEFKRKAPTFPEAYQKLGYSCWIHGTGMDDEPPFIPYNHDSHHVSPEGVFKENMVLSVEFYAGKEGGRDGVKLEEQVWLTPTGPIRLSQLPFDEKFLR